MFILANVAIFVLPSPYFPRFFTYLRKKLYICIRKTLNKRKNEHERKSHFTKKFSARSFCCGCGKRFAWVNEGSFCG
jgi:hypothetical protein